VPKVKKVNLMPLGFLSMRLFGLVGTVCLREPFGDLQSWTIPTGHKDPKRK